MVLVDSATGMISEFTCLFCGAGKTAGCGGMASVVSAADRGVLLHFIPAVLACVTGPLFEGYRFHREPQGIGSRRANSKGDGVVQSGAATS